MLNLVSLTCPSFYILGKTQTGVFITPKLVLILTRGAVTKLDKRNKAMPKEFDDNIIVNFSIYGQFGVTR